MKRLVVIRGAGEIATGIAHSMYNAGFKVVLLEKEHPAAIRREIAFAEAAYSGEMTVERVICRRAGDAMEALHIVKHGAAALLADPQAALLPKLKPMAFIDASRQQPPLPVSRDMAPLTIGIGHGFCAGRDVTCVVETMRGHNLGRIIYEGRTMKEDDPSAIMAGMSTSQVVFAPQSGRVENGRMISLVIHKGETIGYICASSGTITEVKAPIDGVLRGLVHDGYVVGQGEKMAEIDPRTEPDNCFTISAKSRCIAGSVLEAVLSWEHSQTGQHGFFHKIHKG